MRLLIILSVALLAGCQSTAPQGYYYPPAQTEYPQLTPREPVDNYPSLNYPSLNCISTTVGDQVYTRCN